VYQQFDRLKSALSDRYAIESEPGSGGMATIYLSVGLAAAVVGVAAVAAWGWLRPTSQRAVVKVAVALPAEQQLTTNHDNLTMALSPDGSRLAYVGSGETGRQLYLRDMRGLEARAIPGTEGAHGPFFSPDGRWIGFFASSKLMKVPVDGGPPIEIAIATNDRGGTWTEYDAIVFAPNTALGLHRVSKSGGAPEPISQLNADSGEVSHRWPHVLPGGEALLFTIWKQSVNSAILATLSWNAMRSSLS
jgi:serine/threonine-protein kinase